MYSYTISALSSNFDEVSFGAFPIQRIMRGNEEIWSKFKQVKFVYYSLSESAFVTSEFEVEYGQKCQLSDIPSSSDVEYPGHKFVGWNVDVENDLITDNTTISAMYEVYQTKKLSVHFMFYKYDDNAADPTNISSDITTKFNDTTLSSKGGWKTFNNIGVPDTYTITTNKSCTIIARDNLNNRFVASNAMSLSVSLSLNTTKLYVEVLPTQVNWAVNTTSARYARGKFYLMNGFKYTFKPDPATLTHYGKSKHTVYGYYNITVDSSSQLVCCASYAMKDTHIENIKFNSISQSSLSYLKINKDSTGFVSSYVIDLTGFKNTFKYDKSSNTYVATSAKDCKGVVFEDTCSISVSK